MSGAAQADPSDWEVPANNRAAAPSALYQAMTGMGAPEATGWTGPLVPTATITADVGRGKRVAVLGAGISGLTAAFLLNAFGFTVEVLEAQNRYGGRNFTARDQTEVIEQPVGGNRTVEVCQFDGSLYLNLGPGRIPYHHRRMLTFCQQLQVALEPYVMETTANRVQTSTGFNGEPRPNRRIANDTRGHLAALLTKLLKDTPQNADLESAAMFDLLAVFGDLNKAGEYQGSTRSGYRRPLDPQHWEEAAPPLPLSELLASRFWQSRFYQPVDYLWQSTMFQPVGGMDQVVNGFVDTGEVGRLVKRNAPVLELAQTVVDGRPQIKVTYQGKDRVEHVPYDYCLSSIPFSVLSRIPMRGFSTAYQDAVRAVEYVPSCKVGWQANERFWEADGAEIYGGISWTDHLINQIWYPSNNYFADRGTLTGAYNFRAQALELGEMEREKRLRVAREGAQRLHPEFGEERIVPTAKGITIAWHRVPYQYGAFADWKPSDRVQMDRYARLLSAEGRFHAIGDQVSPLPGWQEGAMMSAEFAVRKLLGQESLTVTEVSRVPDTAALTEGRV